MESPEDRDEVPGTGPTNKGAAFALLVLFVGVATLAFLIDLKVVAAIVCGAVTIALVGGAVMWTKAAERGL